MKLARIEDISFDEEDFLLFESNIDLKLKAKAIQFSILPKLNVMVNEAISTIRDIYGIEVLDDCSTVLTRPAFREKRENELKFDYTSSYAGIGGVRKSVWKGLEREDKKDVKIIPFTLGFELDKYGISTELNFFRYVTKLTKKSYNKYFLFLQKYLSQIITLLNWSGLSACFNIEYKLSDEFEKIIEKIFTQRKIDQNQFVIFQLTERSENMDLEFKIGQFVVLYPIYDSLIRISLGEEERFLELLDKLDFYLQKYQKYDEEDDELDVPRKQLSEKQVKQINKTVDGINVRTGIRWQVFERDDFKCVACGASALDGAILHVDHILPRSKGGKDELSNFQTLCHLCNIGKSNKSERNLRER